VGKKVVGVGLKVGEGKAGGLLGTMVGLITGAIQGGGSREKEGFL